MTDSKTIWSYAAYAGLILGLVSSAYYTCDWALGKYCTEGALLYLGVAAKIGLWIAKFVACIALMRVAMLRFVRDVNSLSGTGSWGSNNGDSGSNGTGSNVVTNADTFRLGAATAVLSALIYSGFLLAFVLFIQPDLFEQTIDGLRGNPMLTDAAMEAVDAIAPKFPAITFFSNLIYCSIFGTVLSSILSRNIPSRNPFK